MTYETWCKHFTGIHNDTCKAGIKYNDVKVQDSRPLKLPCFKDQGCTDRCAFATFRTPEEVAAEEEKSTRILRTYLDNMARNICPHCYTPIEERMQVGRCVYAQPCGCRLYQGKLRQEEEN